MATANEAWSLELAAKSKAERAVAVHDMLNALPDEQKDELRQAINARLGDPDAKTSNRVWLIVIWAFAIVLVLTVSILGIGYFKAPDAGGTKPETLFAIFTTVAAFLVGLFAPSPVAKGSGKTID